MSDTFLLTWCQEGKPHPIGWAHRDIYGEKCLKDILWTNATVDICPLVLAHTKTNTAVIYSIVIDIDASADIESFQC